MNRTARPRIRLAVVVRRRLLLTFVALLLILSGSALSAEHSTVRIAVDGTLITGTPLAWSGSRVLFLSRSGYLWKFPPTRAKDFRQVSNGFRPFSQSEMRGQLQREFGRGFDVSGTGNYLVVHPAGQRDKWAQRFEDLYRSFVHYFSARGMRPAVPEFPLVAVVFSSREGFARYVAASGGRLPPGVIGLYSAHTNRVMLYDVTQGNADDANWYINAETIIHEATHQMAFNTKIHSRSANPPLWICEGLATLFEAPGVWNARHHPNLSHRINRSRFDFFRQYATTKRPKGSLATFIASPERVFRSAPSVAYAEAWALTFFLSEREPAKYVKYLARTAGRTPLKHYSDSDRLREFTNIFGTDLKMIEARYLRFIQQLK